MGWKKGELIMTSEPYAHVLSSQSRQVRCSFCLRSQESVRRCTACSVLRYCGRDCQRQDWPVHKVECKCLQRVSPDTPPDHILLMLRLIIKQLRGEHTKTMEKDPGLRTFEQFMSHVAEIKQDANCNISFSAACLVLSQLAGTELQLPNKPQMLEIFGKMAINSFTINDEEIRGIGRGVYLSPSLLDHRCVPNAVVTFRGKTLQVRAVDDIPDGELGKVGETVYMTYVRQLAPSWERQKQLQEQYFFTCQCPRCHDSALDKAMADWSPADSVGEDVNDAVREETSRNVHEAVEYCKKVTDEVGDITRSSDHASALSRCRECLAKVKDVLSPTNIYLINVLDRACDAARHLQMWKEALGYGVQALKPYKTLLPRYNLDLARQLLIVGKVQLEYNQFTEARSNLEQAQAIFAVTHGKDSVLYTHVKELLTWIALLRGPKTSVH